MILEPGEDIRCGDEFLIDAKSNHWGVVTEEHLQIKGAIKKVPPKDAGFSPIRRSLASILLLPRTSNNKCLIKEHGDVWGLIGRTDNAIELINKSMNLVIKVGTLDIQVLPATSDQYMH
ncbi:hypothetical protein I3271_00055 [Photobacterium leiognathi]|uniref:hypothetical protein n=1 Tax=Photobacterium leiognathi TaxID=553611 RepID=UPI001EE13BE4|nr:hypothetical protein [Photobacterium leiognathi]MCG3883083.1 hypothetical protein [Photobacterium leiognathi]